MNDGLWVLICIAALMYGVLCGWVARYQHDRERIEVWLEEKVREIEEADRGTRPE